MAVLGAISGEFYLRYQQGELREVRGRELAAIAATEAEEISAWRRERLRETRTIAIDPYLASAMVHLETQANDTALQAELLKRFELLLIDSEYAGLRLTDRHGVTRLRVGHLAEQVPTVTERTINRALASPGPVMDEWHTHDDGAIHLPVISPLRVRATDAPVGYLVMVIDPHRGFFARMKNWTMLHESGEMLLLRDQGGDALYLNEAKYRPGSGMHLTSSPTSGDSVALAAIHGDTTLIQGTDYRHERVLAAARPVSDSEWVVVAKMDEREAIGSVLGARRWTLIVTAFLSFLTGLFVLVWWRSRRAVWIERMLKAEIERTALLERYAALLMSANDAVVVTNDAQAIIEVNDRALALYGYRRDEMLGMDINRLRGGPEPTSNERPWLSPTETGVLYETEHLRKDSSSIAVEVSARTFFVGHERFQQAIVRDNTERKRNEALRSALAAISGSLVAAGPHLNEINRAILAQARRLTNSTSGFVSVVDPTTAENVAQAFTDELDGVQPPPPRQMVLSRNADGSYAGLAGQVLNTGKGFFINQAGDRPLVPNLPPDHRPIQRFLAVPATLSGKVVGEIALANPPRDYTDRDLAALSPLAEVFALAIQRTQTELAVKASEGRYRMLASLAPAGIFQTDAKGECVFVNARWCELTGMPPETALGQTWSLLIHPDDRDPVLDGWRQAIAADRPFEAEHRLRTLNGREPWVYTSCRTLKDDAGRITGYLVALVDVTERKQFQERIARTERLASVGTLAAGVAHEINNPLAYVLANTEFAVAELSRLLSRNAPIEPAEMFEVVNALEEAAGGADRVRRVVRDLRTFSRVDPSNALPVNVEHTLESAVNILLSEIRQRARLVTEMAPVPPVLADETQLSQVFVNLLLNATQAIPEGESEHHEIRILTRIAPDQRVLVEIRDTGRGMNPDVQRQLFNPFFTTRRVGEGMGLGLAVSHGIIAKLGGEIQFDSEPGKGSSFRVLLKPAAETPAQTADQARSRNAIRRGRLLVIDDDPLVGTALVRTLKREHDAVATTSPREALELLAANHPFDLILVDVMMPDMSGPQLYDAVKERHGDVADRVVFMTAGAFTPRTQEFLESFQGLVLPKPVDSELLNRMLIAITRGEPLPKSTDQRGW